VSEQEKPVNDKLTPEQQDARIKELGLDRCSKDTLMLMVVDLEAALPLSRSEGWQPPRTEDEIAAHIDALLKHYGSADAVIKAVLNAQA
jgi:hypothetical protein